MSRVGKMPITVPQGVDVSITTDQITVKGANGTLVRQANALVEVRKEGAVLSFAIDTSTPCGTVIGILPTRDIAISP